MTEQTQEHEKMADKLKEQKKRLLDPRHYLAKAMLYFRRGEYGRALYLCDTLIPGLASGRTDENELIEKRDKLRPKVLEGMIKDVNKTARKYGVSSYGPEFCELSEQCKIYRDLLKQFSEKSELDASAFIRVLRGTTKTDVGREDADYLMQNLTSIMGYKSSREVPEIDLKRCYNGLTHLEGHDTSGKYEKVLTKLRSKLDKISGKEK